MKRTLTIVIIPLVVIAGAWFYLTNKSAVDAPATTTAQKTTTNTNQSNIEAKVDIKNTMFTPSQVSIDNGGTVTWTNNDTVAHNVIVDNGEGPSSDLIQPGSSYSYEFTKPGSYQYHCSVHPSMRGTIVVR